VVSLDDGTVVRSSGQLSVGTRTRLRFADGGAGAAITDIDARKE
jgi:hypothetical protein